MASKRVLISVHNKTGIVAFASALQNEFDYEIISTGGTEKVLREAGLKVTAVQDYTGFPEMLDGRVKTLHPAIHGGLLALRGNDQHLKTLVEQNIGLIDMVVVNLYPFQETVASGASFDEVIEQIDIGGPSMLRSAAKNHQSVAAVPSPDWYERLLVELRNYRGYVLPETRKELATEVFWITAQYDSAITKYLSEGHLRLFPAEHVQQLRYGENPHQKRSDAWRIPQESQQSALISCRQLEGKGLSFLNYWDADAALNMVREFAQPAVSFVKHANPCGLATHDSLLEAFRHALDCDPRSAFGVIIALNRPVTLEIAEEMEKRKLFVEVIVAPSYEPWALRQLEKDSRRLRILEVGELCPLGQTFDIKKISGGYITQDADTSIVALADLQYVTSKRPTEAQINDLLFAWKVVKHVKSNAIVLTKDQATVGIGAGQMSRVDSTEIAVRKAGERAKGSVLASDAFFPFADSVEEAAKYGIAAIIQPGGSIRDQEVIAKADELGIPMVFTGKRAFKH
ncbi:MAG: bifunctional phosphoribosylaminoimidazolecarboxamide formyltransferase/IMP cyclohydrolase [bacterium]|nr:bifunctional phosphoribosylaminoimidazolecarboxamide formyltransferase/IMP cyclohydrolase [bacterium]